MTTCGLLGIIIIIIILYSSIQRVKTIHSFSQRSTDIHDKQILTHTCYKILTIERRHINYVKQYKTFKSKFVLQSTFKSYLICKSLAECFQFYVVTASERGYSATKITLPNLNMRVQFKINHSFEDRTSCISLVIGHYLISFNEIYFK